MSSLSSSSSSSLSHSMSFEDRTDVGIITGEHHTNTGSVRGKTMSMDDELLNRKETQRRNRKHRLLLSRSSMSPPQLQSSSSQPFISNKCSSAVLRKKLLFHQYGTTEHRGRAETTTDGYTNNDRPNDDSGGDEIQAGGDHENDQDRNDRNDRNDQDDPDAIYDHRHNHHDHHDRQANYSSQSDDECMHYDDMDCYDVSRDSRGNTRFDEDRSLDDSCEISRRSRGDRYCDDSSSEALNSSQTSLNCFGSLGTLGINFKFGFQLRRALSWTHSLPGSSSSSSAANAVATNLSNSNNSLHTVSSEQPIPHRRSEHDNVPRRFKRSTSMIDHERKRGRSPLLSLVSSVKSIVDPRGDRVDKHDRQRKRRTRSRSGGTTTNGRRPSREKDPCRSRRRRRLRGDDRHTNRRRQCEKRSIATDDDPLLTLSGNSIIRPTIAADMVDDILSKRYKHDG